MKQGSFDGMMDGRSSYSSFFIILLTETNKKVCPNFSFQQKDAEILAFTWFFLNSLDTPAEKWSVASPPMWTPSSTSSAQRPLRPPKLQKKSF